MIRYALACDRGHGFESWFRDSAGFDEQVRRGLVACPFCNSANVAKQIMAPAVARTDRDVTPVAPAPGGEPAPLDGDVATPMMMLDERERAFRAMLRALREHVVSTAENVGPRFADEARKMHDGLSEFRAIYGEATADEARALAEDGIEAMALPVLADDRH